MSLKTLSEFSGESNAFDARFGALRHGKASDAEASLPVDELLAWLRTCVAHGRYLPERSPDRDALQGLVDYWTTRLLRLGHALHDDIDRLADFEPAAGIPLAAECPYPGLDPYTDRQRAAFFGREALVASYVARLEDPHKRILLIIGASGSGKSSLVLAGVLPKLEERHRSTWLFAPRLTPGDHPVASLAAAVAQAIGEPPLTPEIERRIAAKPADAMAELARWCRGKPLLLLVDQFEELFTLCRDANEQKAFGDLLCALSEPDSVAGSFACRILLTLRTDHLARFESSDALKPLHMRLLGQHNEAYLSAIGFLEIKRAIAEPAKQVGLRFCPTGLIDQLASQTAGLANGLPLLQFALRRLWDTRPRNAHGEPLDLITEEQVNALPDVQRALGTVADGIFRQFTPAQRRICERMLQELVVLDENFEEPLRRRRNEGEMTAVLRTRLPAAEEDVATVIEQFTKAGLLRRFGEGPQRQIEVAHEALLRHWEHINRLVTGERVKEQLHLIKQVGREAAEWVSRGKSEGYLNLRSERLERALEYAKDGWLAEVETTEYVEACDARERAEKVREAQAQEAKLRAQEAEEATERARLEIAQAEKREAEAREREATIRAKKKTVQLWLVGAFGLLVLGGLLAWKTITDQHRDLENRRSLANESLNTLSALGVRLPPWEGLDVAYSLVQQGDPRLRFSLAHALERMDNTWLVGEHRNVALSPNQDGSALLQVDRTPGSQSLHVYPIDKDTTPGSTRMSIPLRNRVDSLELAQVGPPIGGKSDDRLAVLVFHDESDEEYIIEAYHLQMNKTEGVKSDSSAMARLDKGQVLSAINFATQGTRAVFSAIDYRSYTSTIYRIGLNSSGRPEMVQLDDPAGPDAFPASAVAFVAGATDADPVLVTGRLDGSVYCGQKRLKANDAVAASDAGSVREIVVLPGTDVFALTDSTDAVYAWSCADAEKKLLRSEGKVSGVTLTWMQSDQGRVPLLGFLDDNQPRCHVRTEKGWSWRRCNPLHRVSASIPLPDGQHLTVELGRVAAVQIYPIEMLARKDLNYEARRAGSTVVRWESPESAAKQFAKTVATPPKSVTDAPSGKSLPWRMENGEWVADNTISLVTYAALSRDGKWLTWMEQRPNEAKIVARAWKIGDDKPAQLPTQSGQPVSVAIANDGTLVHGEAVAGQSVEIRLDGVPIDSLDRRDQTACLAFSPKRNWLVAGTVPGGRVRAYAVKREPTSGALSAVVSGQWEKPFEELNDQRSRPITACDIGDDGTVVVGSDEGQVRLRRPGEKWLDLTARASFRLAAPVEDVAIDHTGQHVSALSAWQRFDCSRPGLPGQALRVWNVAPSNDTLSIPIASACFPNQVVLGVGELVPNERGEPGVMLVTGRGSRWHGCPGCARANETPEAMLARLVENAKKAGAQ